MKGIALILISFICCLLGTENEKSIPEFSPRGLTFFSGLAFFDPSREHIKCSLVGFDQRNLSGRLDRILFTP